jgi:hypothetical protein
MLLVGWILPSIKVALHSYGNAQNNFGSLNALKLAYLKQKNLPSSSGRFFIFLQ